MPQQSFTEEEFAAYRARLESEGARAAPMGGGPPTPLGAPPTVERDYSVNPPSPIEFGENVLRSGGRLVGDIWQMGTHPIETGKAIGSLAVGAVSKMSPTLGPPPGEGGPEFMSFMEDASAEAEAPFNAVVEHMKKRYGSIEAASRTAYEDPMGFAADLSVVLSAGGAALRAPSAAIRAGGLSKSGQIARVGTGLARAGETLRGAGVLMDPIQLATKMGTSGAKGALYLLETMITEFPGLLTGTGGRPLKTALGFMGGPGASKELTAAMRGKTSPIQTLRAAKSALSRIKEQRGMTYRARLAELPKKMQLNLDPLRDALGNQMRQYGISWSRAPARKVKGPRGRMVSQQQPLKLDFSRSTISSAADQGRVRRMINDINDWGSRPADLTPLGVDTLRRRLDDIFSESGQARAMTTTMAGETRKILDDVPGYTEMTRDYSELSSMIKEIETELSLGSKSTGTSLRKLMGTFSETSGYREQMLAVLDQFVVDNLGQQIAGLNLRSLMPAGLAGKSTAAAGVAGAVYFNPQLAILAAMSSPRIMGEVLVMLSKVKRAGRGIRNIGSVPAAVLTEPAVFRPAAYATDLPPPPSIPPGSGDEQ